MGEDTKKPDPQSTTTPSSHEQQPKKEATTQAGPPDPATKTTAQKKDDEATPTTPPQQAATTPPDPSQSPSNDSTTTPPPTPPQPPNDDTKQGEDKGKSWVDVIKDSVTILGGSTVVIAALFVFVGRIYAEGYFNALSIPISSISFSEGDYSEIGFFILIPVIIVITLLMSVIEFLKIAVNMIYVCFRKLAQ
ncbi:MAG: hypothetical protein AAGF95_30615 [Chloroflexota bacterium]